MTSDNVTWHFYLGYLVLGLLFFRIIWGMYGPVPVRFKRMLPTAASTLKYISNLSIRKPSGSAGHNPLGSLWIFAILLLLMAQGITGLFIEADDFYENGPLFDYITDDTAGVLDAWHSYLSNIILTMVILHVSVLVFYRLWKKENLVIAMITGWKWVRDEKTTK